MLNLKHGNESYAGFASFTFDDLSPRAREELTQRGFKIYDPQLAGRPIGFDRSMARSPSSVVWNCSAGSVV